MIFNQLAFGYIRREEWRAELMARKIGQLFSGNRSGGLQKPMQSPQQQPQAKPISKEQQFIGQTMSLMGATVKDGRKPKP